MFGRNRLPTPATAALALERDERVIGWAQTPGGSYVIATNLGLWWPGAAAGTGGRPARRIAWYLINKAVWSEDGLAITEAEIIDDLLLVERPELRAQLVEQRKLPAVVRNRVEASVAQTHEVTLSEGVARIVGRRVSGQDGLSWWAVLVASTPDTALVRAEVGGLIERFRAEQAERMREL